MGLRCDTHVHVFEPASFPYADERAYTPGVATVSDLEAHLARVDCTRVVLVQPSVYGTDNRCLLNVIAQLGQDRARGVAVVDVDRVTDDELRALRVGGVRGIRLNVLTTLTGVELARQQLCAARRIAIPMQLHVQLHADFATHSALLDDYISLTQSGVPAVLDHFAGATLEDGDASSALTKLTEAMRLNALYVKLSAAYRLANLNDAAALVKRFHTAAPERVLWGSDWPHTGGAGGRGRNPDVVEPFRDIDNTAALNLVSHALGDAAAFARVLCDNAARLYGFSDHA